jgi:hypothetical protein
MAQIVNENWLLWVGESVQPLLSDKLLGVAKALTPALLNDVGGAGRSWWQITHALPSLLLRLYEQSEEQYPDVACQCLDMWDTLFERRIGMTRELARAIDA